MGNGESHLKSGRLYAHKNGEPRDVIQSHAIEKDDWLLTEVRLWG